MAGLTDEAVVHSETTDFILVGIVFVMLHMYFTFSCLWLSLFFPSVASVVGGLSSGPDMCVCILMGQYCTVGEGSASRPFGVVKMRLTQGAG